MRIAVYIEKFSKGFPDEEGNFLVQLISRTAQLYPESEIIFIMSRFSPIKFVSEKNILILQVAPITANTLLRKAWLDIKLPALLKKYNADIFIGDGFCSLKAKIPQCLFITDDSLFVHGLVNRKNAAYHNRTLPRFFKKAKSVICFSSFIKNKIVNKYGGFIHDLQIITPAVEEIFTPLNETDKNKIKQDLTGGSEYFIYTGELHAEKSLIDLLKAFSLFKKMQQSSMKLVLAGKITSTYKKLIGDLNTYKYRDAVIIKSIVSPPELVNLLGAAYAVVLPSGNESCLRVLQAMRSGSPVITASRAVAYEIAGDSAFYFNEGDHSDLAARMMHLYKDEDTRKTIIEKSRRLAMNYSMDDSAKLLWQAIEEGLK